MPNQDSGQEPQDSGLPEPTYSGASDDKPNSGSVPSQAELDKELLTKIDSLVDKKLQSQKDRRWSELERQYGELADFRRVLDAVKAGEDPDKVYDTLERQHLIREVNALKTSPSKASGKEPNQAYEEAVRLIKDAGLDNDPMVREVLGGTYNDPSEMLSAVAKKIIEKNHQPPSGVTAAQPNFAAAPPPSVNQYTQEYKKEMMGARGKGYAVGDAIKQKYRELGVDVDHTSFSV